MVYGFTIFLSFLCLVFLRTDKLNVFFFFSFLCFDHKQKDQIVWVQPLLSPFERRQLGLSKVLQAIFGSKDIKSNPTDANVH